LRSWDAILIISTYCVVFTPSIQAGKSSDYSRASQRESYYKLFSEIKKELWGGELWSDGYYLGTIGERGSLQTIEKYIRDQGQTPAEAQLRLI